MAASNSKVVLSLYKLMVRESFKFVDFNYRNYALRRVKHGFRQCAKETDQVKVDEQIRYAKENLEIIKRQTRIGHLFGLDQKLSVELAPKKPIA